MASGSLFQSVGAAEEKKHSAVLFCDLGTVGKSILAELSSRYGTYGSSVVQQIEPVCFIAQVRDLKCNVVSNGKPIKMTRDQLCAADV